jgi:hypothetical protein
MVPGGSEEFRGTRKPQRGYGRFQIGGRTRDTEFPIAPENMCSAASLTANRRPSGENTSATALSMERTFCEMPVGVSTSNSAPFVPVIKAAWAAAEAAVTLATVTFSK